jgi:hypothetical protein
VAEQQTIAQWLQSLPISWLFNREHGYAAASAEGALYDGQVTLLKEAVKARMPLVAPVGSLPQIGGDRKLIQGYNESDDVFRVRLQYAFEQWALAGTWVELLYQLYFTLGFEAGSAYIVQQNGLAYTLSANPEPDEDPAPLLVVSELGLNYNITYPTPVPWWSFDARDDLCSRFAIILGPGALPASIQPRARATFDGTSSSVVADWTWGWDITNYRMLVSPAVTTDGTAPVVVVDSSANTNTTVTVNASAPFTGYVDVLGFVNGTNPFASPSASTQNLINQVVATWRPAKATFMGTWVSVTGNQWGWPIGRTWGSGIKWGAASHAYFGP